MAHHPSPLWESGGGLSVARFRLGPLWNFCYVLACESTREAAVIDPAWDPASILAAAEERGLRVTTVLLTHSHSDHVNAVAPVASTGARILVHAGDEAGLQAHTTQATTFHGTEAFGVGSLRILAHPTPGHTPGSVCYSVGGRMFTGDTLAVASPGTPGPEPGALEALWRSTRVLAGMADDTVIHPGHDAGPEPAPFLRDERARNPGLVATTLDAFRAAVERATGRSHA